MVAIYRVDTVAAKKKVYPFIKKKLQHYHHLSVPTPQNLADTVNFRMCKYE